MQKMPKTASFHGLALAAAAALAMAGTAVVAAEANDADMPWVSHLAAQPMQGVTTWQERCAAGEAGDLRQRLEARADITRAADDVALRALRDASSSAGDASTGAFVVDTDEGPMLLIVTDDADAPYTLVALHDAVILPATD